MSKKSDNRISISGLLPEVFKSSVNQSLSDVAFDRYLSKDDTTRVVGYVGDTTAQALVNRRIPESTPHRQAFQLAPTMVTNYGTQTGALGFQSFLGQLELMGVDISKFNQWGATKRFNWVPPINIDMLINYKDYFWKPANPSDQPDYFVIESKCAKAKSKVGSYRYVLNTYGSTFAGIKVLLEENAFTVSEKKDALFAPGFVFTTKSASPSLTSAFWTVASSTYNDNTNTTTITVIEPIAALTQPPAPYIGTWWKDQNTFKEWNGTSWVAPNAGVATFDISLEELLTVYQAESNCACSEGYGWDIRPWDDNQIGDVVWNVGLMASISAATEASWSASNGAPQPYSLWYDVSTDTLKQRNMANDAWVVAVRQMSAVLTQTTGSTQWDGSTECEPQKQNQWIGQNKWIHKTEVQSFAGVSRAQMPILEYDSDVELNEWVRLAYQWNYRMSYDDKFAPVTSQPHKIELEPIGGYQLSVDAQSIWTFVMYDIGSQPYDHSKYFVPGRLFRVADDTGFSETCTVQTVQYRRLTPAEQGSINVTPDGYFTVVTVVENNLNAPPQSGGVWNCRIEPVVTSSGHPWRGYGIHWMLDTSQTTATPVRNQRKTFEGTAQPVNSITDINYANIVPPSQSVLLGYNYQQQVIDADTSTFTLANCFRYGQPTTRAYALAASNDIRVYVNDVRQYGTYTELTEQLTTPLEVVGYTTYPGTSVTTISGIKFDAPVARYSNVRIEVGAAAFDDLGLGCVPVRTVENEDEFATQVAAGMQPVRMSLTSMIHAEQSKTGRNQYPQFNVYDVVTSDVIKSANLFGYTESSDAPINGNIQRRVVSTGLDFSFTQNLTDRDDNILYGFHRRDVTTPVYWKRPGSDIFIWDGYAWTPRYELNGRLVNIEESDIIPSPEQGKLWYAPTPQTLKIYTQGVWASVRIHVGQTDPSIQTIWRDGASSEYVPAYVDANRQPVPVGSSAGDWEVCSQWFNNSEHQNKTVATLSQLITHFGSIIKQQPGIPGLMNGGVYTKSQREYDYAAGGTIKEHNGSFDTLISSVNVGTVTPVTIIEFAQREYAAAVIGMRESLSSVLVELLSEYSSRDALVNFTQYAANKLVDAQTSSDALARVYSDTTSYDSVTKAGVKNWVASAVNFGLTRKFRPHVNQLSSGKLQVVHHDGHRSTFSYTQAEFDRIARQVCAKIDQRTGVRFGVVSSSQPPSTKAAFELAYGAPMQSGNVWYVSVTRSLYKLRLVSVGSSAPSLYDLEGVELPDGSIYYDTAMDVIRRKVGSTWVDELTANDISIAWSEVRPENVIATAVLSIESKLYETAQQQTFDVGYLSTNTSYLNALRDRFNQYVSRRNIVAPFVNAEYVPTNPLTWNYSLCVYGALPKAISGSAPRAASWQALYTEWFGTPYPHLEPWKLQGYGDKPTWWDAEYADTTGQRRWKYNHSTQSGLWQNIKIGRIPSGRSYPNGVISTGNAAADGVSIPTYSYMAVNIANVPVLGIPVDGLIPPYFDNSTVASTFPSVRSLFNVYNTQIVAPDGDYVYGKGSPVEWEWTVSSEYVYDRLIAAFIADPVNFVSNAFGVKFTNVRGLQIETLFKQMYSHRDALFHGDVYSSNQVYASRGLNQWYVNYNRATGVDTNGEFRTQWAGWEPKLTYQFGSIVDTGTCEVSNRYFDIVDKDFDIALVNSGVIRDHWLDSFSVSLLQIPPQTVQYNSQSKWKLALSTNADISRTVQYYGVKQYDCVLEADGQTFTSGSYKIISSVTGGYEIDIAGDASHLTAGSVVTVGSTSFTVDTVEQVNAFDATRIRTVQPVVTAIPVGSILRAASKVVGFAVGDPVVMHSTNLLPSGLYEDTVYYAIPVGSFQFKLADSFNEAVAGIALDPSTSGGKFVVVSGIKNSFRVFGGAGNSTETWYHVDIDYGDVRSFSNQYTFRGMQTLINIVDGFAEMARSSGIVSGVTSAGNQVGIDPMTGRTSGWDVELERFIDWAYAIKSSRLVVADSYQISVDASTSELSYVDVEPHWISGTAVRVRSNGALPQPLSQTDQYFVASLPNGNFRLSTAADTSIETAWITVSTPGTGSLELVKFSHNTSYPSFELNPSRTGVRIDTPTGVLSNVIAGPYADIRIQQTIYDQYGRTLGADKLHVFRSDESSLVTVRDQLYNDLEPDNTDPYQSLHISGAHFFTEGYEHYLIFNNRTVDGSLMYDQFLGLRAQKVTLDFYKQTDYSLQPVLGGYFLVGGQFKRNLEGTVDDLRSLYDFTTLSEASALAGRAKGLLGYRGRSEFLDLVNLNKQSQFLFYKGMIQSKGSVNSINAYINSRRFIDAKMDEFWAVKLAEFGQNVKRAYPEIKLLASDSLLDDVRLEFTTASDPLSATEISDVNRLGFSLVSFQDESRWNNFPAQRDDLISPLFIDAQVTSASALLCQSIPVPIGYDKSALWFNTTTRRLFSYSEATNDWTNDITASKLTFDSVALPGYVDPVDVVYFDLPSSCDDVRVLHKSFVGGDYTNYSIDVYTEGQGVSEYSLIDSRTLRLTVAGLTDLVLIQTLLPAYDKISPARLLDVKSHVVVTPMPMWDPARGYHSPEAQYNVDVFNDFDPARYNSAISSAYISANFWNNTEEGTIWVDTNELQYVPYFEPKINIDVNARLYSWGKLAPWAAARVYRWTRSLVPPQQWTELADSQSTDTSIDQSSKASGKPKTSIYKRSREPFVVTINANSTVSGNLTTGDTIIFRPDAILPDGLIVSQRYIASMTSVVGEFDLTLNETDDLATFTVAGTATAVKAFTDSDWLDQQLTHVRIPAVKIGQSYNTLFGVVPSVPYPRPMRNNAVAWIDANTTWVSGSDTVDVYLNGYLLESALTVTVDQTGVRYVTLASAVDLREYDVFTVVKQVPPLSKDELLINLDVEDDGTALVERREDYKYSYTSTTSGSDAAGYTTQQVYYFWVEDSYAKSNRRDPALSALDIKRQLVDIPTPYITVQKPRDLPELAEKYGYGMTKFGDVFSLGNLTEQSYQIPVTYRQVVLRKVASYVTDDDRFVVQFTRDAALRDQLRERGTDRLLNPIHEEWLLIRRTQPNTINRMLWDKLTESMIGHTLADSGVRVPALERELYDSRNGTSTQYGMGESQTFVNRDLAIATVLNYLSDPTRDFSPVDVNQFLQTYKFTDPADIRAAMETIYVSFNSEHVNNIWFECLMDALTTNPRCKEIFKTSWIALHGVRVLEVGGLFDE